MMDPCNASTLNLLNSQSFAAFLGAFFAFVFGLIAYRYDKKRERIIKHQNATVELGYLLNEHLDDIWKDIFLINGTLQIFGRNVPTYNHLNPLRVVEDLELRLGDLELINMISKCDQFITGSQSVLKRILQSAILLLPS